MEKIWDAYKDLLAGPERKAMEQRVRRENQIRNQSKDNHNNGQ